MFVPLAYMEQYFIRTQNSAGFYPAKCLRETWIFQKEWFMNKGNWLLDFQKKTSSKMKSSENKYKKHGKL